MDIIHISQIEEAVEVLAAHVLDTSVWTTILEGYDASCNICLEHAWIFF